MECFGFSARDDQIFRFNLVEEVPGSDEQQSTLDIEQRAGADLIHFVWFVFVEHWHGHGSGEPFDRAHDLLVLVRHPAPQFNLSFASAPSSNALVAAKLARALSKLVQSIPWV